MKLIHKILHHLAVGYLLKGGVDMVALYEALILAGRRTLDQVPAQFHEAIKADFAALGLDENGLPITD